VPIDVSSFVGVYDVSFDAEFHTFDAIAEVSLDGDEVRIVLRSDGHGLLSTCDARAHPPTEFSPAPV